jgi:hypothetical protein
MDPWKTGAETSPFFTRIIVIFKKAEKIRLMACGVLNSCHDAAH